MSLVWFVIRDLLTGGLMGRVETDELIDMPFWNRTRLGPRNRVLDGGQVPTGRDSLLWV